MTGSHKDRIKCGFIHKPHGLHGFLKVSPLTDFPEYRFAPGEVCDLEFRGTFRSVRVEDIKVSGEQLLVKFEEFTGIEEVQSFRNLYLYLPEGVEREDLNEDDFYMDELVGLIVKQGARELGRVFGILDLPSSPVLQVKVRQKEILIPFVKAIIHTVDLENGEIHVSEGYAI